MAIIPTPAAADAVRRPVIAACAVVAARVSCGKVCMPIKVSVPCIALNVLEAVLVAAAAEVMAVVFCASAVLVVAAAAATD